MRLSVIIDQPFCWTGNGYSTSATFIDFVLQVGSHFEETHLFVPVSRDCRVNSRYHKAVVAKGSAIIHPLPFFQTATEMYRKLPHMLVATWESAMTSMNQWDLAWVVASHLHSLVFYLVAKKHNKPCFAYFRSDVEAELTSHGRNCVSKALLKVLGRFLTWQGKLQSRDSLIFVTGNRLGRIYGPCARQTELVFPSVLRCRDILARKPLRSLSPPYRLLFVGRLTPEKGIDVLIEAVAVLKAEGLDLKVSLVGDGKLRDQLERDICTRGLSGQFHLHGVVPYGPELLAMYEKAHLFINPSHTEGIPKTLYEAMARACPIVATRVGGVADVIRHGENGLLVQSNSPVELVGAIRRVLLDPKLRERLRSQGLAAVREYTLEGQALRMYNKLMKFYDIGDEAASPKHHQGTS